MEPNYRRSIIASRLKVNKPIQPYISKIKKRLLFTASEVRKDKRVVAAIEPETILALEPTTTTNLENSDKREYKFTCDICGKKFNRKHHLKEHFSIHSPLSKSACHICDIVLASKKSLNVHLRIHKIGNFFQCNVCKLAFKKRSICEKNAKKCGGTTNIVKIDDHNRHEFIIVEKAHRKKINKLLKLSNGNRNNGNRDTKSLSECNLLNELNVMKKIVDKCIDELSRKKK